MPIKRDVIAARGAVHFDKRLLSQLLQPDAGEAIATRYDPNDDTYYIATTSGKTYKFPRYVIDKARVRESSGVPTLFDADGTEIPSSYIEQQIREFEKAYKEHAKERDAPQSSKAKDGKAKGKGEPKPKTFDEAWEMAEARLAEAIMARDGVEYGCHAYLYSPELKPCKETAEVSVTLPKRIDLEITPLCAACAYLLMENRGVGILDSADE